MCECCDVVMVWVGCFCVIFIMFVCDVFLGCRVRVDWNGLIGGLLVFCVCVVLVFFGVGLEIL